MYGAAAGGLLSAYGAIKGSEDQAETLDQQADIQRRNAQNALIAAKLNADKTMMQFHKIQGQDIANYGASGVSAESGSVLATLASNVESAELDKQNILYGGQIRATNFENQASIDETAADRASSAGLINAASGLFLGASRMYGGTGATPSASQTLETT